MNGDEVIKTPRPGQEYKVETDYNRFQRLGELAPRTEYDQQNNRLVQEAVKGRFATESEMEGIREKVRSKGYAPRGLLTHDVIIQPNGEVKVIDVGNFERIDNQ